MGQGTTKFIKVIRRRGEGIANLWINVDKIHDFHPDTRTNEDDSILHYTDVQGHTVLETPSSFLKRVVALVDGDDCVCEATPDPEEATEKPKKE